MVNSNQIARRLPMLAAPSIVLARRVLPRAFLRALLRSKRQFIGVLLLLPAMSMAQQDQWAETVSRVADSVVSLQLSQLRSFDDSGQGGSAGTGFVVDAERGIILTNRHIAGAGPARFSATFQNQERVDAVPLYRDPVHDFAFLRYDPAALQYAQPYSLPLRPEKVKTGLNIRVIGSDGGEQLSILTGTIARVDREVPSYGRYGYNDFNTFYLQAASSTSGGSSGSPVIDFDGDVVALNAAANSRTAASFFLPLYRIQRALKLLQDGEPITRGTIQSIFVHRPYRQLRRLGLDEALEAEVRRQFTANTGLLVVSQVLPGGATDNVLAEGDILYSINDSVIGNFVQLESLLDQSIGEKLQISVIRQGEMITVSATVADLHALDPNRLLEFGDSVLQDMSIQHVRAMNLPPQGVVVMRPGYFFARANIPGSSVIVELDGQPIASLDDAIEVLLRARDAAPISVRYIVPGREFTSSLGQLQFGNRWFRHRLCTRVDNVRFWDCERVAVPSPTPIETTSTSAAAIPRFRDPLLNRVAPAMVLVDFDIPYASDNVYASHFQGVGLVVDAEQGLVAVDRNTVPISLGDTEITFFGSQVVPGRVAFLHPKHNIALVQYDPAALAGTDLQALELGNGDVADPERLFMIGYRQDGTFRKHEIDSISPLTVVFEPPRLPRFQQTIADVFGVPDLPPSLGGPLVDDNGVVHSVWMSFAYQEGKEIQQSEWAIPAALIQESLRLYRAQQALYDLDTTLDYKPIALARQLGLPDFWLRQFNELDAEHRRVLYVEQLVPGTDAAQQLRVGDVLLAIDDQLVTELFAAERLVQRPQIAVTVLRNGEVLTLDVRPSQLDGLGTRRVVSWAGALFQEPHRPIAVYKGIRPAGVYIADTEEGSPALWDRLYRNRFVTAVDGVPVTDLDEFLAQVRRKGQDEITRLSLVTLSGRRGIVSVQPEYNFWPTFEVRLTAEGWQRINYANDP